MRIVRVDELSAGMVLSSDVFNDMGNVILGEGTVISDRHLEYLINHSVEFVYVKSETNQLENDSPVVREKTPYIEDLESCFTNTIEHYKHIYLAAQEGDVDVKLVRETLTPLVSKVTKNNNILESLRSVGVVDDYTFKHSIHVSIFSAFIAKWLGLSEEDIELAALSGLLHDIGKCRLPQTIINKKGKVNQQEFDIIKDHTTYGYSILKNNADVDAKVLSGVLFHHERIDGSGYPRGIRGTEIPLFARIVGVADVFDAITSDRPYSKKVSTFKAFTIIKEESFNGLDPKITEVFLTNISKFFVGNIVKLNDGRVCEVVYVNRYELNRPLIKHNEEFIDLSQNYTLEIVEVL